MQTGLPSRILYFAGPGDVIGTYQHWREGQDDPGQLAVTDSGQFFDVCRELGLTAKVISYHRRRDRLIDDTIEIEHRPAPMQKMRGLMFHLGWWVYHLSVCWTAIVGRYDTLVLMATTHIWPYWPAKWLGKRIILVEQCVIWPKILPKKRMAKTVHQLDRGFFRSAPEAIISMSQDITDQIEELTGGKHPPIIHFLPSYRRSSFAKIPEANHSDRPFRVLFAGRTEANKGVFDIIEMGRCLKKTKRTDIVFEIAGDGSAMPEMKRQIDADGLQDFVVLHGYCQKPEMRQLLIGCYAIILPTKADMVEGFNKVVAEAVMAHRPWITSHLCPAITYVRDAGIEVPPDDVQAYLDAVLKLADDRALYDSKVRASHELAELFYDPDRSWATALKHCLSTKNAVKA